MNESKIGENAMKANTTVFGAGFVDPDLLQRETDRFYKKALIDTQTHINEYLLEIEDDIESGDFDFREFLRDFNQFIKEKLNG